MWEELLLRRPAQQAYETFKLLHARHHAGEHLGREISAAQDGDCLLGCRQLPRMKQLRGGGDRSAGLGNEPRGLRYVPHGRADLVLSYGDDVIHVSLDVLERNLT